MSRGVWNLSWKLFCSSISLLYHRIAVVVVFSGKADIVNFSPNSTSFISCNEVGPSKTTCLIIICCRYCWWVCEQYSSICQIIGISIIKCLGNIFSNMMFKYFLVRFIIQIASGVYICALVIGGGRWGDLDGGSSLISSFFCSICSFLFLGILGHRRHFYCCRCRVLVHDDVDNSDKCLVLVQF